MQVDSLQFMNLVIEKTNKKLNELQAQVLILEAQLQLATDINKQLQDQLDKSKKKDKSEFNTP